MTLTISALSDLEFTIRESVLVLRGNIAVSPHAAFQAEHSFEANNHRYTAVVRIEPTFHQCFKVTVRFRCETQGISQVPFADEPVFRQGIRELLSGFMTERIESDGFAEWELDPERKVGEDEIGCCVITSAA